MIEIKNLTKNYDKKIVNNSINISIEKGNVYGIIGPNGAGKTTLIRQIMGFVNPDDGLIKINGFKPIKDNEKIMEFTGYVSGENVLYNELTGSQYLDVVSSLHKHTDINYKNNLIDYFEIDTDIKIKKMSKGMKQKIAIIAALMHKPKFLVLDEPTSGLDPLMQNQFNELIKKINKDKKITIILCTHIFQEAAKLCDKIGFLKNGILMNEFNVTKNNADTIEKQFISLYSKKIKGDF